jgi:hypothetical protein
MSLDEKRVHHHNIINRRRYKSLDKNKKEYFFPNNNIRTERESFDFRDYEYFKPRIKKNRKFELPNYNSIITYRNNNNVLNNRQLNQSAGGLSSYNKSYLKDNEHNNNVPRIQRKKNKIDKYINKDQNLNDKKKITDTSRISKNIMNNSMDKDYYIFKRRLKNNNINDNNTIKLNNISYNKTHSTNIINKNTKYNNKKNNRNSSYDNKNKKKDNIKNLLCTNCFDLKMLEDQDNKANEIDRKEQLNERFILENPFYFIDVMNEKEKNRIKEKIDYNTNRQRLALANFKKEVDKPKNNAKENLQLINEYSLNPLSINDGKDPRYLKQKKNFDKKENIIYQNPNLYKSMQPRKAYNDYYNKCIYQIPNMEKTYYRNPVYKENYIKALKKQIEDKKIKEYEKKKKQNEAESFALKQFNEYKKKAEINEKVEINKRIIQYIDDNKQLKDFKE